MKTCNEYKDKQLRDYFLNRLSPEETEAFQFHLIHCEACRTMLLRMRQLAAGKEWESDTASDAVRSNDKHRRLNVRRFIRVAAAVLLVGLLGGGYYFMRPSSSVEEEIRIEMQEAPVLHAADSVVVDVDSTVVGIGKEEIDGE